MSTFCVRTGAVLLLQLFCSCSSPPPVPRAQVEAAEARLLSPYQQDRTVLADNVSIEISGNFYTDVTQPAANPALCDFEDFEEDGDQVYRWVSRGGIQAPLRFEIGRTRLVSVQSATLRVRGTGKEFALRAHMTGHVTETKTGADLVNLEEVRIENGVYRPR